MLLFLIEPDTSNKGSVPPNRRDFMLPPSPEMVLDGARQIHKVEIPQTPPELGHEHRRSPQHQGKQRRNMTCPDQQVTSPEREHHTPLQKPHLPA